MLSKNTFSLKYLFWHEVNAPDLAYLDYRQVLLFCRALSLRPSSVDLSWIAGNWSAEERCEFACLELVLRFCFWLSCSTLAAILSPSEGPRRRMQMNHRGECLISHVSCSYVTCFYHVNETFCLVEVWLLQTAAPEFGGSQETRAQGPPPKRASQNVYVFSHMCDMCVPLSHY